MEVLEVLVDSMGVGSPTTEVHMGARMAAVSEIRTATTVVVEVGVGITHTEGALEEERLVISVERKATACRLW